MIYLGILTGAVQWLCSYFVGLGIGIAYGWVYAATNTPLPDLMSRI